MVVALVHEGGIKAAQFSDADAIRACDTPQPEINRVIEDALAKAGSEGKEVVGHAGGDIDPDKTYVVAGSTFLLGGGDNFKAFTRGTAPANLGYVDLNALVEALGSATADARISADAAGMTANEYGTATVKLTVPADLSGTQQLRITTDAGTNVTVPVDIAPAPAPETAAPSFFADLVGKLGGILPLGFAALVGMASLIALLFPFEVDRVLGPIAKR